MKFKIGDYVKGTGNNMYALTNKHCLSKVTGIYKHPIPRNPNSYDKHDLQDIKVKIIQFVDFSTNKAYVGKSYLVNSNLFEKTSKQEWILELL